MEDDKEKEWGEISGICDLENEVNEKTEENDGKSSKQFDQQTQGSFETSCKYSV